MRQHTNAVTSRIDLVGTRQLGAFQSIEMKRGGGGATSSPGEAAGGRKCRAEGGKSSSPNPHAM